MTGCLPMGHEDEAAAGPVPAEARWAVAVVEPGGARYPVRRSQARTAAPKASGSSA